MQITYRTKYLLNKKNITFYIWNLMRKYGSFKRKQVLSVVGTLLYWLNTPQVCAFLYMKPRDRRKT